MTQEEILKMEAWCDWACGDCSRSHVKWKAARLGYIRGMYEAEQKLNKPVVSGKQLTYCQCEVPTGRIRERILNAVHKCLQWEDGEIAGIDMLKLEQRIDGILEQLIRGRF